MKVLCNVSVPEEPLDQDLPAPVSDYINAQLCSSYHVTLHFIWHLDLFPEDMPSAAFLTSSVVTTKSNTATLFDLTAFCKKAAIHVDAMLPDLIEEANDVTTYLQNAEQARQLALLWMKDHHMLTCDITAYIVATWNTNLNAYSPPRAQ